MQYNQVFISKRNVVDTHLRTTSNHRSTANKITQVLLFLKDLLTHVHNFERTAATPGRRTSQQKNTAIEKYSCSRITWRVDQRGAHNIFVPPRISTHYCMALEKKSKCFSLGKLQY